jgi:CRP/FNR family cyclic AMP-dependent transcriptional regulator
VEPGNHGQPVLLTYSAPTRELEIGEVLINQGEFGTELYVLESGQLAVERDGVKIATIDRGDSLVGEMGLLLQRPHSATVRAETNSRVRVVADAMRVLERHPDITLRLASLLSQRLDETSGLLSELSRRVSGAEERTLIGRILAGLVTTPRR